MQPARIAILSVAVVAAGLAGYLAMSLTAQEPVVEAPTAPVVVEQQTTEVLVTAVSLPLGSRIGAGQLRWQAWPQDALSADLIMRPTRPTAVDDLVGAVVRVPLVEGEPVRSEKLVDGTARVMSSLLPAGKRAVSTDISVSTSAGGFILPNDRVDVIMVRRDDAAGYQTDVVLRNIRVLAIDQNIQQNADGSQTAIGSTATLELTTEQAKALAVARTVSERLTLALRSVADAQAPDTEVCADILDASDGNTIQMIRNGAISTVRSSNKRGDERCWFDEQDPTTASIGE